MPTAPVDFTPAPRNVDVIHRSRWRWLIPVPFALVALGIIAGIAIRLWITHAGMPVTVAVDRAYRSASPTRARDRPVASSDAFHVEFHYDWQGHRVDDAQQVSQAESMALPQGQHFPAHVTEIGGRPICLIDLGSASHTTWVLAVIAMICVTVVGLSVRSSVIIPRRQRRIVEIGTEVTGLVTSAYRARKSSPVLTVDYDFSGPAGPGHGRDHVFPTDPTDPTVPAVTAGQTITVLCDPHQPANHVVYEWSGFTVRNSAG